MKKNFSTVVLFLVLGGLVAWYAFYENKFRNDLNLKEDQEKLLISMARDAIQNITITKTQKIVDAKNPNQPPREEKEVVKLKKVGGEDWLITEPIQDSADPGIVGSMLTTIATSKQERVVEENAKDLNVFGLGTPKFTITVNRESTDQTILIGDQTQVGFGVYAKLPTSNTVYRVNRILQTTFEKSLFEIRNKNLLDGFRADATEVEIQGKESFLMTTNDKSNWLLARENMPANATDWNKTLTSIMELKATAVVSEKAENLKSFGLDKPLMKISVTTTKDKPKQVVDFGKVGTKVYAKRDSRSQVYEVDSAILTTLQKPAASYRSQQVAKFNRFDIQKVKLNWPKTEIVLTKKDSTWTMSDAKPEEKVDSNQVDKLLTKLQDMKVSRYLTASDMKLATNDPRLVIEIFEAADKKVATLRFGKADAKEVTGMNEGVPLPFVVKIEDFDGINVTRKSLLEVPKTSGEAPVLPPKDEKKS